MCQVGGDAGRGVSCIPFHHFNHFKSLNQFFGGRIGDLFLLLERLKNVCRCNDLSNDNVTGVLIELKPHHLTSAVCGFICWLYLFLFMDSATLG